MNNGPFGLPPMVFGIGFGVVWLGGGLVVGLLMSRRKSYRQMLSATAASYEAQQQPGAHPWGDLIGLWYFKSAARWIGVTISPRAFHARTIASLCAGVARACTTSSTGMSGRTMPSSLAIAFAVAG